MIFRLKLFLLFCAFSACFSITSAQSIKGTVKDSTGNPLSNASVNLKSTGNLIIGYASTNQNGVYILPVPADAVKNSLSIEVGSVGFKKQTKLISDLSMKYDFALSIAVNQLKTVLVKNDRPMLKTSGDTTSYRVSDFSNPQDRVIGDVIRKLPGIQVSDDGKIKYNGKSISSLKIGGDNLLDDKYNIATKSIPNGVVDQVQVIENDQPVKMLRGKVVSDDVALNLTIKKDAKLQLVGQESIGGGLPGKYNEDLNAMMFKDSYKAINYLKANNTSVDLQNDLLSHNLNDYLNRIDNDKPAAVLSMGTAGDPDLPRNRYLFNQSALLNLNNMVHLQKDVLLRANVYYLHDMQRQNYQKMTEVYLSEDTVRYNEVQDNRKRYDVLHSQFTLNINRDKYYLNNVFSANYDQDKGYSNLVANGSAVNQLLKDNTTDISNELNLMKTLKTNQIINVYSYLNRYTEPEYRALEPGYQLGIFNHNRPYQQLVQTANVPSWFTNNYIDFKVPSAFFTQSYKVGFSIQSQKINSELSLLQSDYTTNLFSDSSVNNLSWLRKKVYAEAIYDLPGRIFKVTVKLPVNLMNIHYSDQLYALSQSLNRLYFNPGLTVKYQTSVENYLSLAYNFRNDIGNIQDVFQGQILKNYRTLYANNADLTENKTQTAALGFNYRKALSLFFFNINAMYTHADANNIASSLISNNLQQRIVLPFENAYNSWTASAQASKYYFPLHTTFSSGIIWQSNRANQILNGLLLPYTTASSTFNIGAEAKVSENINMSYKTYYTSLSSKVSNSTLSNSKVKRLNQQAALNYNPEDHIFLKLSGDHYFTSQTQMGDLNYVFADFSARYKFKKSRLDLELAANNLFNTKTYDALYLSGNTFTSNSYTIPGRMLLMKMMFNL